MIAPPQGYSIPPVLGGAQSGTLLPLSTLLLLLNVLMASSPSVDLVVIQKGNCMVREVVPEVYPEILKVIKGVPTGIALYGVIERLTSVDPGGKKNIRILSSLADFPRFVLKSNIAYIRIVILTSNEVKQVLQIDRALDTSFISTPRVLEVASEPLQRPLGQGITGWLISYGCVAALDRRKHNNRTRDSALSRSKQVVITKYRVVSP